MPTAWHNPVTVFMDVDWHVQLDSCVGSRQAVVVTPPGANGRGWVQAVQETLGPRLAGVLADVQPNPTIAACSAAVEQLPCDANTVVIGLGGGSALDTAKAVAAGSHRPAAGMDWLSRHLRQGAALPDDFCPAPLICLPTTAGTGSEVTMWATIWDEDSGAKYSLAHPALYAEAAILDPTLTLGAPHAVTVAAALDALSHSLESLWNHNAHPIADALALQVIRQVSDTLPALVERPDDLQLRRSMQRSAMMAGMCISATRTALAHSMSYPLTARFGLPHGLACSFTLPEILRLNAAAQPQLGARIAGAMGEVDVEGVVERLYALLRCANVPQLVRMHIDSDKALDSVSGALITPGRAHNNLASVNDGQALALLKRAYANLMTP